jgi:hypothetical protein
MLFLSGFLTKTINGFLFFSCALHALAISSSLTSSFRLYLAKSKRCEAPNYEVLPDLPLFHHCCFLGWVVTEFTWYVGHYYMYTNPWCWNMNVEQSVQWQLAGEAEGLGEQPAPKSLSPPQILLDLTWARTRAAAMGIQRLTAWAKAQPIPSS